MHSEMLSILSLLVGGSGGGVVLIKAVLDYKSSAAKQEKEFNKGVIDSLKDAQIQIRVVENERRDWEEYASELIGFMLREGIPRSSIPKPPDERISGV